MAFLGDFGKGFQKVIHNPVVQVVFPVVALANVLASKAVTKVLDATHPTHAPVPSQVVHETQQVPFERQPINVNYPQPYSPGASYGDPFGYQPNYYDFGGQPWGYSTGFQTYSTPQYQTYSAPPQDRTWEDLITLGAGLFL